MKDGSRIMAPTLGGRVWDFTMFTIVSAINNNQNFLGNWVFFQNLCVAIKNKWKTMFRGKLCVFIELFFIRKQIKVIFCIVAQLLHRSKNKRRYILKTRTVPQWRLVLPVWNVKVLPRFTQWKLLKEQTNKQKKYL